MGRKEEFNIGHKFGHLTLIEELAPVARGAGGCSVEDCFLWYKQQKEAIIKRQAEKYKEQISYNVYLAMYNYQVEITD